eukprot:5445524-Pyramimonas_sp.AAC.1
MIGITTRSRRVHCCEGKCLIFSLSTPPPPDRKTERTTDMRILQRAQNHVTALRAGTAVSSQ